MFRATDLFHSIAQFVHEVDFKTSSPDAPRRAAFAPDTLIGALMPVYCEIAQRLSRKAYTTHGMA